MSGTVSNASIIGMVFGVIISIVVPIILLIVYAVKNKKMWIVPAWLGLVLVIVFFCGFKLTELDSSVLITLLATTTVNVLGLAYIVLKGIFNQ